MEHLYNSAVKVMRMQLSVRDAVATMAYAQATDPDPALNDMLKFLKCRIDLNFVRPGKDALPAPVAGRAPDRVGLLSTYAYAPLRAGDRLVCIANEQGELPVEGTFEIRQMPDPVVGFSSRHHIEVQVIETGQEITAANWPTEAPIVDPVT